MENPTLDRRTFVKAMVAVGATVAFGTALTSCGSEPKNEETPKEEPNNTVGKEPTTEIDADKVQEFQDTVVEVYDNIIESCKPENLKETGGKILDKATDGFIYFVDLMNGETTIGGYTIQELKSEVSLGCGLVIGKAQEEISWAYDYVQTEIDENYPDLWDNVDAKKQVVVEDFGKVKEKFIDSKDKLFENIKEDLDPDTVEVIKETVDDVKANGAEVLGYAKTGITNGYDWVKTNGPEYWEKAKDLGSKGWDWVTDKTEELKENRAKEK